VRIKFKLVCGHFDIQRYFGVVETGLWTFLVFSHV
jgi:hypothetical protein